MIAWRLIVSLTTAAALWLALRLSDALLWERLLPRYVGVRFPRLLRQVVAVAVGIIGAAIVLSQVWKVSVAPVLATTGAIGIVAGLALRNVLADFFSGIALNMERPFRLDDFVLLHVHGKRDPVAGFVREVNWRSTTVLTPEDNLISVPNSLVAASTVENLSFPSPVYELELDIVLDWHLDPAALEPVLAAAMVDAWVRGATSGDKPPKFRISKLDGAGVTYRFV
ncbi:MAG: mechanosensitive ion channel domain-containing protein, partial [Rhizobacter sp.]